MRSRTPKPLHQVGGRAMLAHVLAACGRLAPDRLVVVAPAREHPVATAALAAAPAAGIAVQAEPDGTAGALLAAAPLVADFAGDLLVVFGDGPLIRADSLTAMRDRLHAGGADAVLLAFETDRPEGYGRILRDPSGAVTGIVEERDATPEARRIRLCAAGPLLARSAELLTLARRVPPGASGERYLTAIPALLAGAGQSCRIVLGSESEALGVNSRAELAAAEAAFQRRARAAAMAAGVTLEDPDSTRLAFDTRLDAEVEIGAFVRIGNGVSIAGGAVILPFTSLEGCEIGPDARVGPHARIRPGTVIGRGARIGNYVEVKASRIGEGAKVGHLAYVGDTTLGPGANVGAGAITCNYDGRRKHRTEIGAGAFIGSNCCLVAPLRIGEGAYVGSGSVITRDVEPGALAISRGRQQNRPGLAARYRPPREA